MAKEKDPSLLVHLDKEECKEFDRAQGGIQVIQVDDAFIRQMHEMGIDIPNGQIRDYRPLAKVIENPEVQEIFKLIAGSMDEKGNVHPELEKFVDSMPKQEKHFQDVPEHSDELKALAKEGEGGDTEIVYMPLSVCNFLDSIKGEPSTNPNTGFPQYGFWKNLIRIAGPVIGAIIGGPIGAGAIGGLLGTAAGAGVGAGIGRMGSGLALGEKPQKFMREGLHYGAGAAGMGLAGPFGAFLGRGASGLGMGEQPMHAVMQGAKHGLGWGAMDMGANFLQPGGIQQLTPGGAWQTAGQGGKEAFQHASHQLGGQGAAQGAGGIFGSLFGNSGGAASGLLGGNLLPLALAGGATLYGANMLKKGRKEEIEAWERENARTRAEKAELRRKYGMDAELPGLESVNEDIPISREREGFSYYKKGGSAKDSRPRNMQAYVNVSQSYTGKSKGQADNLKRKLPGQAYVINATAVAHLGDGNTPAGRQVINNFEKNVQKGYKGPKVNKTMGTLDAATSDGEETLSPLTVTILGDGHNSLGADRLDHAIARLMKEKASHGAKLPPKAKPFEAYFR